MGKRKTLQELTIRDNFMFAAVMSDPENCRRLLEMVLKIPIGQIEVDIEKSIVYHPEYHGIRLDVFSKDEKNTRYSVEMQVNPTPVKQRSRYYHSEIDSGLLLTGASYDDLPDVYVIFICDYDPFKDGKYVYTATSQIEETKKPFDDGSHTIILSTQGQNVDEIAPELVCFLNFVHAGLKESKEDFHDDYIRQLQKSIAKVKGTREMEMRYMVLERLLREEKEEGIAEGKAEGKQEDILDLLEELAPVPESLAQQIRSQHNLDILKTLHRLAARTRSVDEFAAAASKYLPEAQEMVYE